MGKELLICLCTAFLSLLCLNGEQIIEYGERCLSCKGVLDASECRKTIQCWPQETCFTEKILNVSGTTWYNFGCKTKEECSVLESSKTEKRFNVEFRQCQKCCNGSLCNIDLCNDQKDLLPCLFCEGVSSPQNCNDVTICAGGQQCYAEKYLEHGMNPFYNFGCAPKVICDAMSAGGDDNTKRRPLQSRARTLTKRATYLCQRCCSEQGCNADICDTEITTQSSSTRTTPNNVSTTNVTTTTANSTTTLPINATAPSNGTTVPPSNNTTVSTNNSTTELPTNATSQTTVAPPTAVPLPVTKDCWELRDVYNVTDDGLYTIDNPLTNGTVKTWCDMTTDGGGWIVLQRRLYGNFSFDKDWDEFEEGFGDLTEAFWWGNEKIYEFNRDEPMVLRIDLWDVDGDTMFAEYGNFSLSNSSDFYRLNIGGFRGPAGKIMYYFNTPGDTGSRHAGQRFTTKDKDHDSWVGNCAIFTGGGFWLDECCIVCPNGRYKQINSNLCMGSVIGDQILHCVQKIEMKFRPASVPSSISDEFIDPPV